MLSKSVYWKLIGNVSICARNLDSHSTSRNRLRAYLMILSLLDESCNSDMELTGQISMAT